MNIKTIYQKFLTTNGVVTDSRKSAAGAMFVCIQGENFNGNTFAAEALLNGAAFVVVDDKNFYEENPRYICVEDSILFLQQLAMHHREYFTIPIICIGGSNGKTSTREITAKILESQFKTHSTSQNLNNHIGVPLVLLSMPLDTEIAVIEIGANHMGEHKQLLETVKPTHIYITNHGKDHIGEYGSYENAVHENLELYRYGIEHNCITYVLENHPELINDYQEIKQQAHAVDHLEVIPLLNGRNDLYLSIEIDNELLPTHFFGDYMIENFSFAVWVAKFFGVSFLNIKNSVQSMVPVAMRGEVKTIAGSTVIFDCYNANPTSMKMAVDSFKKNATGKTMVILGGMKELGKFSQTEHQEMIDYVQKLSFDEIVFVGSEFESSKNIIEENIHYFETNSEAKEFFSKKNLKGFTVLLKGSRGTALEKIFE